MNVREVAEQTRQKMLDLAALHGSRRAAVEALNGCGLSPSWLLKFLNGEISNPTIDSVSALQTALSGLDTQSSAAPGAVPKVA